MQAYPSTYEGITITKQILTTSENISFLLVITKSDVGDILYLGGKEEFCIKAQINAPNTPEMTGNLANVYYGEACALNRKLKRGIDTQYMLRTMICYIKQTYPTLQQLTFIDASKRECNDTTTINLAHFSYLQYGETWYMRVFGAVIPSDYERKFQIANEKLQQEKKFMSWNQFFGGITGGVKTTIKIEEIKEAYETTNTWQEFVGKLKSKMDISDLCKYMSHWMDTLLQRPYFTFYFGMVNFILPLHSKQLQDLPFIQVLPYTESQSAGFRKTKRRRRHRDIHTIV
jgi:hypothetical protein